VSPPDLSPLISSLDGLIESLDDLAFAQLAAGASEDPEAVARMQREFARARRALEKARETLSHLPEVV